MPESASAKSFEMKWGILVFFVIFLSLLSESAGAQYSETVRSGRPGQSIDPFGVGKGIFQVQSGVDYFSYNIKASDNRGHGVLHNTVIRYGVAELFEISSLIDYQSESQSISGGETTRSGLSAFDLGGRTHIYSGSGLTPSVGFQLRVRVPVLSKDYEIDKLAPRFIIVTSQNLTQSITLVTNTGASWNGVDDMATGHYVVNLSFPLAGKWGAFIENYGNFGSGKFETRFDSGFAFLANNDLQFDILGGYGSNKGRKDYFISVGVSCRTKRK